MTDPFLSCDWGTTSFRLRLVTRSPLTVLDEVRTPDGAKAIHGRLTERGLAADPRARAAAFSEVLGGAVATLQTRHPTVAKAAPIVISGMASSTVGWRELPYGATPCALDGSALHCEEVEPVRVEGVTHRVRMISGLSSGTDIMRGEETEILGLLAAPVHAGLRADCVVILPGTHAKHVEIRGNALVDFQTHMTGELLELLSTRSLLSVSVQWPPPPFPEAPTGTEKCPGRDIFQAGVERARAVGLSQGLFQVRVAAVLRHTPPESNALFLAGLLIGSELLETVRRHPGRPFLLAASPAFLPAYRFALELLGAGPRLVAATVEELRLASVRTHALVLAAPALSSR